jgi:hypothetical protein
MKASDYRTGAVAPVGRDLDVRNDEHGPREASDYPTETDAPVGCDLDAIHIEHLVEIDYWDPGHGLLQLFRCEELSWGVLLLHAEHVPHHGRENALGSVRHEDFASERAAGHEEGHRCAVVKVEVGDESHIDVWQVVIIKQG